MLKATRHLWGGKEEGEGKDEGEGKGGEEEGREEEGRGGAGGKGRSRKGGREGYDNDYERSSFTQLQLNDALYNYGVPRPSSELTGLLIRDSSIPWGRSHNFSTSPKSCGKKDGGKVLSRCSHTLLLLHLYPVHPQVQTLKVHK